MNNEQDRWLYEDYDDGPVLYRCVALSKSEIAPLSICTWKDTGIFAVDKPHGDRAWNYIYYRGDNARRNGGNARGLR